VRPKCKVPQPPLSAAEGETHRITVDTEIQALEQASVIALRAEWRRLFGGDPPRLSRDLLMRAVAYRVQERALGGLSRASLKRLREFAENPEDMGPPPAPAASPRPGAKLVREWHGRTHVVIMTDKGFDYAGSSYQSLTQIAKLITRAHWSGPRFFGLTTRPLTKESGDG
jgi:hypothetical protein